MKWFLLSLFFLLPRVAHAWGRHDVITSLALQSPEFAPLRDLKVTPEPIESAAPDLLKRVIPELEKWCLRFHQEHDSRYDWKIPEERPLTAKQELLWMLEDNIDTPLETDSETNAAEVLISHAEEPDGLMDAGLNHSPYIERLRESMSLFYQEGIDHTHAFRHFYVPRSLVPPILVPKGIAPYRAALYSRLASGAFATGHPYWGYRFLAWALHYTQDVTQPWHTVFVPRLSFLKFSRAAMKHEIEILHYLTEAFADSWMEKSEPLLSSPSRGLASSEPSFLPARNIGESLRALPKVIVRLWGTRKQNPWFEAELLEELANSSHKLAAGFSSDNRDLFSPVVDQLDANLKPKSPTLLWGDLNFHLGILDFDGFGATDFLTPIWSPGFLLAAPRDRLLAKVNRQINAAIGGSRLLLLKILEEASGECGQKPLSIF